MPWGTLKDQWERRTALKIAVRQTLSQQMSVGRSRTVDWFANMFANLSTAHDHWFSTARPLRLRPTPWGTRKVILRSPRFSAVNCPQTARTVDVCLMWPGLYVLTKEIGLLGAECYFSPTSKACYDMEHSRRSCLGLSQLVMNRETCVKPHNVINVAKCNTYA